MQTLARQLDPRKFDFKTFFDEFRFSENFRFSFKNLRGDLLGGVTSAIVALPLALGFGLLAYNGNPEGAVAGLYGAIFTGILASLFGGTPQQITGPTGVAVPHGRSGGANSHIVVVFARLKTELQYDPSQPERVKLVFMVSTGSNEKQYLEVLRMIATNISNKRIHERLLTAEDKSEVHHVFTEIRIGKTGSS